MIRLDGNAMPAIGPTGTFAAGDARFYPAAGANAGHDEDDRVVYNITTGNDVMAGGGGADSIVGGAGNDTHYGDFGNDWIEGGAGNDSLSGGGDQDSYVFREFGAANADTVVDFGSGWDMLRFDASAFSALGGAGHFAAGDARFYAAAGASGGHEADDRIVYNTTTGQLFYDADGNGAGAGSSWRRCKARRGWRPETFG